MLGHCFVFPVNIWNIWRLWYQQWFMAYDNSIVLFRDRPQFFNCLLHLIICHIYIRWLVICHLFETVALSLFTHICQGLLAVCFCVFFLPLYVSRQDGIFIWRLICLLRLILSCILCGCEMYISVHLIVSVTALSQCFKICVLCVCEQKERQTMGRERDDISEQICQQLFWLLQLSWAVENCLCPGQ